MLHRELPQRAGPCVRLLGETFEVKGTSARSAAGHWKVARGTGAYAFLRGNGQVTMLFPPDVPRYTLSAETITGVVWLHP